jgi:acetate kinase
MTQHTLVLNAGSSSLKFCVFASDAPGEWRAEVRGMVDGIGSSPAFRASDDTGQKLAVPSFDTAIGDASDAFEYLAGWLHEQFEGVSFAGVGHRVVHGGSHYSGPVLVSPGILSELRALAGLAPLHQSHNLAAIDAVGKLLPGVPQVACFDTGFHSSQPALAKLVPLPRAICGDEVQRYGFHGLSYEYIASVLPRAAPEIAGGRVIVAHLGSGASLCALRDGNSIDSTFGFTALDGLCMGTRPGALDPGVVLYLFQNLKLSAQEVEKILYKQSGLLGISGVSSDMRDLLRSDDPRAVLALDYFVYRAAREIGSLAAVLQGVDAIVFTAGIGENSPEIRRRICAASEWLGIELDDAANAAGSPRISCSGSKVSAWVIPTDEELMIARHMDAVLGLSDPYRCSSC